MFYKSLKINGEEYPLAVNITGNGEPTESTEAEVAMTYMDLDTEKIYVRTPSGWRDILYSLDIEESYGYVHISTKETKILSLSPYILEFAPYELRFSSSNTASGLKVEDPTDDYSAVNKTYVDNLVGGIESALDEIIAIQNSLIGGDA